MSSSSAVTAAPVAGATPDPWNNEDDFKAFEASGFLCVISRQKVLKSLNGYIVLPKSHPLAGCDYEILNSLGIPIHVEWTYSKTFARFSEFAVQNIRGTYPSLHDSHVIGFDCAHIGFDYIPAFQNYEYENSYTGVRIKTVYRTMAFVENKLRVAAEKLGNVTIEEVRPWYGNDNE